MSRVVVTAMAQIVITAQRPVPRRPLELGYRFRQPATLPALRDLVG